MAFNSFEYLLLVLATLGAFHALGPRHRLYLLIGASLTFYAAWSVPLVSLILISAAVDFTAARRMARTPDRRRRWLLLSLAVNLGLLGYFKYADFFVDTVADAFGLDAGARRTLGVVLPPGISFYTFQTMSYTIDVYRRRLEPTRSFGRFLLYVAFFPQLVAGPIERAGHLLGQFQHALTQRIAVGNLVAGARLIAWGLFKKVVIADRCGLLADRVYADPTAVDGWAALVGTYAFTLQIYCDFSAYSEIARGSARLFGVDLMRNFDMPYLVTNMRDFWRRWHISLSTWFRDYVYIPLGGGRRGRPRALLNLGATMFLSGLWHGAAWNFVWWGVYHGALLAADAWLRGRLPGRSTPMTRWGGWFTAFHLTVLGWVLFRVEAIADVPILLGAMGRDVFTGLPTGPQALFIAGTFAFLGLSALARRHDWRARIDRDPLASALFYGLALAATALLAGDHHPQFIYFQF